MWKATWQRRGASGAVAVALTAAALTLVGPSAAATDFAWTGAGAYTNPNWSNGANWVGGTAPSGVVGTLSFPHLTSCPAPTETTCHTGNNDISGISANEISIDDGDTYNLTGNATTLGAGGIVANPPVSPAGGPDLRFPIALGASQTWSIDGGSIGAGQLHLYGDVTGSSDALTVNLSHQTVLALFGNDVETGSFSAVGADSTTTGGLAATNGFVVISGKLNSTNGNSVTLNDAALEASPPSAAVGPLTSTGGELTVGAPGSGAILDVSGGLSLDQASDVSLLIVQGGTTAGTDYSQLSASGAVSLAGQLSLPEPSGTGCSTLHVGDVDILITTTGALTGTFDGVPDGTVEPLCGPSASVAARINYTAHTVAATIVANQPPPGVPQNTSPPTITGDTTEGQTLTEQHGTWTNNPTSDGYAYQWEDCDTSGNACVAIAGATAQTYTLTGNDVGHTIRVQETASNTSGPSAPATSAATGLVQAVQPPQNTSPPTITGDATEGQTLTEHHGTWTASPTSFGYQWEQCDFYGDRCSPVVGATAQTYTPAASDVCQTLRVEESATNSAGTVPAVSSAATDVVQSNSTSPDFTWTGADVAYNNAWSHRANWDGCRAPSGTVGKLTFPAASPDGQAKINGYTTNDISGLTASSLDIATWDSATVTGNRLTLTGGLHVANAPGHFGFAVIQVPITLDGANTWSIDTETEIDAAVAGSDPLALGLSGEYASTPSDLSLTASVEVGAVTITSSDSNQHQVILSRFQPQDILGNSPATPGDLNGANGNPVSIGDHVILTGGGSLGSPTARTGSTVEPSDFGGNLVVHGPLSLQSGSAAKFLLDSSPIFGSDTQHITATGSATLGGALLSLATCDPGPDGTSYTLVDASGGVSGTFSDRNGASITNGTVVQADHTSAGCPGQTSFEIEYNGHMVTATVVTLAGLSAFPTTGEQGTAPNESELPTTCGSGAPVNCATGTLWHTLTAASIPALGNPLAFTLTYTSAAARIDGPLGSGWTTSYNMRLVFDASGNATITQENGSTVAFARSNGAYLGPPRVLATFAANRDDTYTFTRLSSHIQYMFSGDGHLAREIDRHGHVTTLGYDSRGTLTTITDPAGRSLALAYTRGHISQLTDPMGHATRFSYDRVGNLTALTDPLGRTTTFAYDPNHLLLTITDPRGGKIENSYDGSGRVIKQLDPAGRPTTWNYSGSPNSAAGSTTTITDPRGLQTRYSYRNLELLALTRAARTSDAATTTYTYEPTTLGRTNITDPNGNAILNTYDDRGDLTSTTDPLGHTTRYTYDSHGDLILKRDQLGTVTTYTHNAAGDVLSKSTALARGGASGWSYSYSSGAAAAELVTATNPDGATTRYSYDSAGDQTSIRDPLGSVRQGTYDRDGHILTERSANRGLTVNVYNADGELTRTIDPRGEAITFGYDGDGNLASRTDAAGHTTRYTYNADNDLTVIARSGGRTTSYIRDGDGNVIRQIDGGRTTTYAYDLLNRLVSYVDLGGRRTSYSYDHAGNETASTDSVGRATRYTYRRDNRLRKIAYSDGRTPSVTESYDAAGHRLAMTDGTGTSRFSYDALGDLTSIRNGAGRTLSYTYDPAGNITRMSYPTGRSVARTFDGDSRLTKVEDWLGDVVTFKYDGDSNLVGEHFPAAVHDQFAVDGADRMVAIAVRRKSRRLFAADYTRSGNGLLTFDSSVFGPDRNYAYTAGNQLCYAGPRARSSCNQPRGGSGDFGYNSSGDLVRNGSTEQVFDGAGELCWTARLASKRARCLAPPAAATRYMHDRDGNLRLVKPPKGAPAKLRYDQANRLVAVRGPKRSSPTNQPGNVGITYAYDGDGLRMDRTAQAKTTRFVWDESGTLPLLAASGGSTYIYGPGGQAVERVDGSRVTYLHHDQQGSIRLLTDAHGKVVGTYSYSPWGAMTHHTGMGASGLQYDGEYTDSQTGLQYHRARDYDPLTGQFLTSDPTAPLVTLTPLVSAAYQYANDDPVNMNDPSGLGSCPNGIAIPLTGLCLDNPLNLPQDVENFDQNSQTIDNVPVISQILGLDPFYGDLRDAIYAAQGCQVNWAVDLVNTGTAFLPGPGDIAEWAHLPGGVDGAFAGTVAGLTGNYRLGAALQDNSRFVDAVNGGVVQDLIQPNPPKSVSDSELCTCLGNG